MFPVKTSSIMDISEEMKIINESRFSYIRHINGVKKLNIFNCSNIAGLEQTVHRGNQVVVEIPNSFLILFTGDTFHAGISTWERDNCSYPSNLRIFSYIVENEYITEDENTTSLLQQMFCKQICQIFQAMTKEKIHYPGLLVQYSMSNSEIESLNIGTIMLGDLEKLAGLS